ncbi:cytochrome c oxidase accessory protein CcoG [Aquabacterium sp. J223]|uniref:cytochrome c oxidase accessory protein CcoG n=1 Tax=Aquabacterium sp. J223 TaxID=2898431 RepID=UPI0021AD9CB2|nr:cytochrome c oxidase accessory protein CcoG [Aquabacterium sp. J223]UUX95027.1 cytochrome c oxidase accessory protein CcoG [Aquabacterium sp. J223]
MIPIVPSGAAGGGGETARVVSLYQKAPTIYARAVHGRFARWRWAFVWLTQLVFYGLPWLGWNGRQAVLFDLEARRFYLFGLVLYPQDFVYLTALLVLSALGLFLFTAVAGRLWCGYACPQTVYTELFQWVERRIEGDRVARMRLDASPWGWNRVWRKGAKHACWVVIGLVTGVTFVGYFTPIRGLLGAVASLDLGPWETFWSLFYGVATWGNGGFMREQVCKYMCPYARFQSAMFDRDTMVIGYDAERGEPRGPRPHKADPRARGLGHCVDCTLCVQVCPTGIDIRDGLQYECIGCAACIDACDGVMDKLGYARGLIRYATENGIAGRWSRSRMLGRVLRPRVLVYAAVVGAGALAVVTSLALRAPFRVDVLRDRGVLARSVDDGRIENVYRLQIMNATERVQRYAVAVEGLPGLAAVDAPTAEVGPAQARWVPVRVQLPADAAAAASRGSNPIRFRVERLAEGAQGASVVLEKSTFIVPR